MSTSKSGVGGTDVCFLQVLPLQSNGTSASLQLLEHQRSSDKRTGSAGSEQNQISGTGINNEYQTHLGMLTILTSLRLGNLVQSTDGEGSAVRNFWIILYSSVTDGRNRSVVLIRSIV